MLFQTFVINQPKICLTPSGVPLATRTIKVTVPCASVLRRSGPDRVGGEGTIPKSLWRNRVVALLKQWLSRAVCVNKDCHRK